ncbi:hypothetical protein DFS34DRAFT_652805 [Phlyctochytrium arcticum]|nr:hypothetical protein DFS34DRAFT_652805 [Phlyctochytrium arcticum]
MQPSLTAQPSQGGPSSRPSDIEGPPLCKVHPLLFCGGGRYPSNTKVYTANNVGERGFLHMEMESQSSQVLLKHGHAEHADRQQHNPYRRPSDASPTTSFPLPSPNLKPPMSSFPVPVNMGTPTFPMRPGPSPAGLGIPIPCLPALTFCLAEEVDTRPNPLKHRIQSQLASPHESYCSQQELGTPPVSREGVDPPAKGQPPISTDRNYLHAATVAPASPARMRYIVTKKAGKYQLRHPSSDPLSHHTVASLQLLHSHDNHHSNQPSVGGDEGSLMYFLA